MIKILTEIEPGMEYVSVRVYTTSLSSRFAFLLFFANENSVQQILKLLGYFLA
jgi:hypothetical protein